MRTILVIESNEKHLNRLVGWIQAETLDIQLLTATTYKEGKDILRRHHVDLLILEIDLTDTEDELGLKLAEKYREDYPFNMVIFQTARDNHKYRVNVHDRMGTHVYIPKNELIREKFVAVMKQELERFNVQFTNKIFIYQRDKRVPMDANAILYLEKVTETKDIKLFSYDRYRKTIEFEYISNLSLEKLLSLPGADNLFRCHKSYIINKQMIMNLVMLDMDGDAFKIRYTDDLVPIGRNFRKEAIEILKGILSL